MHEHDLDLIAALADGSLDDESEARALVDSCDVCSSEYRSQLEVLALLAATPPPRMTDLERASLRRELWAEVKPAPPRTGSSWWQRWSYAAAGLAVLVGLVAVLSQGPLGGGEAADLAADTTIAAESATEPSTIAAPLTAEDAPAEAEGEAMATTTAAAAEGADQAVPFPELADEARTRRAGGEDIETLGDEEGNQECLERAGLEEHFVVDRAEYDQIYLLVMPRDDGSDQTVTFVRLADCEIVFVDR